MLYALILVIFGTQGQVVDKVEMQRGYDKASCQAMALEINSQLNKHSNIKFKCEIDRD